MVLQHLVSGSQVKGFGICSRRLFDLNLYGCGARCIMLYAITLRGDTTYASPVLRLIWCMRPLPESASRPRPVTVVLPQCAMLFTSQRMLSVGMN